MTVTYTTALDAMFSIVETVLTGATVLAILGYTPDVRWPGVPKANPPDKSKLWARVSSQLITDGQSSLANANGLSLFDADGILFVQLFCPRNVGSSLENGRLIAQALQTAFRTGQSSGDIWYRNQKFVELPETSDNYPINFSAEFQYTTLSPA